MSERLWIFGTRKLVDAGGDSLVEMVKAHSKMEALKLLLIRHPTYPSYRPQIGHFLVPMQPRDWDFVTVEDITDPQLEETKERLQ